MTSSAVPGSMRIESGSADMCANPGSNNPANETKRPATMTEVKLDSDLNVCVPTRPTLARIHAMEMVLEDIISCIMEDPKSPIFTVLNAMTRALTKMEMPDMTFAAVWEFKLASAKSLKELGTSFPEESCWLMATSAISKPEIKLIKKAPTKIDVLMPIPGPETSSGNTSIPAPTVFPVIKSDVDSTGSSEVSKKFASKMDRFPFLEESQESETETADRLSILRFPADGSLMAGCILSIVFGDCRCEKVCSVVVVECVILGD